MILESAEQVSIAYAGLAHIKQIKIVVIKNVNAGLLSKVDRRGRGFYGSHAIQMATNFGASPEDVVSAPKESEVVYEHGHDRQIGQTNSPTKPATPPSAPVEG